MTNIHGNDVQAIKGRQAVKKTKIKEGWKKEAHLKKDKKMMIIYVFVYYSYYRQNIKIKMSTVNGCLHNTPANSVRGHTVLLVIVTKTILLTVKK